MCCGGDAEEGKKIFERLKKKGNKNKERNPKVPSGKNVSRFPLHLIAVFFYFPHKKTLFALFYFPLPTSCG